MKNISQIHSRLKELRLNAGFRSATEFCKEFKIPLSTYNMHETGERNIRQEVAEKYAQLLKANPVWLLTGTGTPYITPDVVNESPLTEKEFFELLNYKGNKKIPIQGVLKSNSVNILNPLLFSKIILEVNEALKTYNQEQDPDVVTYYAIEIYKDIQQASPNAEVQSTMVNFAVNYLRKQLQNNKARPENNSTDM